MQRQSPDQCIYSIYFIFWVALFQSYREFVNIALQLEYQNMFSRFFTFIPTDNQINLGTLIEYVFIDCLCNEKTHNIDINTCI